MSVTRPQGRERRDSIDPLIPRLALRTPLRIGLIALLLAVLFWVWRPVTASTEALAAADRYLSEQYSGYTFLAPQTQSGLFGTYTLVYTASHGGTPARVVVSLTRKGGQMQVSKANLYIGATDSRRLVTSMLSLAATFALIYLVFFVSIPQTFGRKCPRDLTLLKVTEETVVGGMTHTSGLSLASIIERIYTCRVCDFHHHEAMEDPHYRPTMTGFSAGVARWLPRDVGKMHDQSQELPTKSAITAEEYKLLLNRAKETAKAKSSSDSPWLYRS